MDDSLEMGGRSHTGLVSRVLIRFLVVLVFLGALLFLTAGSFGYRNAWLYLGALFLPMLFALIYLALKDPSLLEKRMNLREKEREQKRYVRISILFVVAAYAIPGLDYRYGWSSVPGWLVVLATVVMISGYGMFMAVMMQNSYASRVVEIQDGQRLIDTGLYSIVRHPMYLAACVLYIASPLVLGSFVGMIPMLALPFILGYRIKNEEGLLENGLEGYREYKMRVRYRLIPPVW